MADLSRGRMMRVVGSYILGVGLVVGTIASSTASVSASVPMYAVTDLGTAGGDYSIGADVNNNGVVTGQTRATVNGNIVAFIWRNGRIVAPLGRRYPLSVGLAVNDLGHVAGVAIPTDFSAAYAFTYDGSVHYLRGLGGTCSGAQDVNNYNTVVGFGAPSGDCGTAPVLHAVQWIRRRPHDIGSMIGPGGNAVAYAINSNGRLTGWTDTLGGNQDAFVWNGTKWFDLGGLPGAYFTFGSDINNSGDVVGESDTGTGNFAFFHRHGTKNMVNLGTLGGSSSSAIGIGRTDEIVGTSRTASEELHAFYYRYGVMTDLNTRIPADSGWVLQAARNITDHGLIVGYGLHNGKTHAFLLTPIG